MAEEKPRYTVLVRTLIFIFKDDQLLLMKYSGKGSNQSQEKADRKDIYNPIGGHVEADEDILESAAKEAMEEAGVHLEQPKIKGIVNVSGFAGKNMLNFIVTGVTSDEPLQSSEEGELHWVKTSQLDELTMFADVKPILEQLQTMQDNEMFMGKAVFEGFELKELKLRVA
jgi:8-oxo-dGTP diphosphatase